MTPAAAGAASAGCERHDPGVPRHPTVGSITAGDSHAVDPFTAGATGGSTDHRLPVPADDVRYVDDGTVDRRARSWSPG